MSDFKMPPCKNNYKSRIRKAGFELEFSNIHMEKILNILQNSCSLKVNRVNDYFYKLGSKYGDFILELDLELLTKQKLKKNVKEFFNNFSIDIDEKNIEDVEKFIGEISKDIVPYEISTPPLPLDKLYIVEDIAKKLNQNNAHGTKERLYYAFGLHINLELVSLEVKSILSYLRAYLVLQDFLNKDAKVDMVRKVTPFIDNFKKEYIEYILDKNYNPRMDRFIDDYLKFNPTRNRSLDMLPVLAFIDEKRVRKCLPGEKIKPRPTFHYRLSNSLIGDSSWNVADEWNRWILVEELANDQESLEKLSTEYLEHLDNFINLSSWESRIEKWLQNR